MIERNHIKGRGGRAFFAITVNVKVSVIGAIVRELMDETGIAVKGKNNGLVGCKEGIKVFVAHAVRMVTAWLQAKYVHDVDRAHFEVGKIFEQHIYSGKRF